MTDLAGVALGQGCAIGSALVMRPHDATGSRPIHSASAREAIAGARRAAVMELGRRSEMMPEGPARQIVCAHAVLIDDPVLTREIDVHLEGGRDADAALAAAASALVSRFEALGNPLLRERGADLRDACQYIARHLAGAAPASVYPHECVICAADLSAADVLRLQDSRPLAFVLERCALTSHAAILIRALGVPAVIGVTGATTLVRDGDRVLVDADRGRVVIDPAEDGRVPAAGVTTEADLEAARTSDGVAVAVTATIAGAADLRPALAAGAEGVGLFRTEWLFLRGGSLPSEEEQMAVYAEVATLVAPRPITVRLADLGGDKYPAGLPVPAMPNPALGLRGVRLALAYPELLRTQIQALVGAFGRRPFRLLLPMVNDPTDIDRVRALLRDTNGIEAGSFELGAMIETPAAALMADEIAAAVDFLSIGTNDLTQYVLAADREGSDAYHPFHPAVLRLVRHAAAAGARRGKPVVACGELAADPLAIPLFIAFGITGLSVPPDAIVRSKRQVRGISAASVRSCVDALLALPSADAVLQRLREWEPSGAADDVRAAREAR